MTAPTIADRAGDEHGTCRSCGAPILWAVTDKGRRIPLDPEPSDDGNQFVYRDVDAKLRATAREPARIASTRHVPHFATCPNARQHRRR